MQFIAIIHRNFRDSHTSSPKVLLTQIETSQGEFRDHCWVDINETIKAILPKSNKTQGIITFVAKPKLYNNRRTGQIEKIGLGKIKQLSVIQYMKK